MSLFNEWVSLGFVTQAVIIVLVAMAMWSFYVTFERWYTFYRMARQSHQFAIVVADLFREQRYHDAIERAGEKTYQFSYLARLISMGLREFEGLRARSTRFDPSDIIQRAMDRAMYAEALMMRRGIASLASIASVAPLVGLFGTIAGLAEAFMNLAQVGTVGAAAVFAGVGASLLTTALGVLVAIPSTWAYNYLVDRIEGFEIQMRNSAAEIVDYCLKQIGVSRGQTNPNA